MNTGAHLLINWALMTNSRWKKMTAAILIGALLPDALMFVFYAYQKVVMSIPEEQIWRVEYFKPFWQNIFDIFNSVPLILALFFFAWYKKWFFFQAMSFSMLIHCALDFPLHHDDAHRHFFPLSNWRYESPVSYWDPAHYGQYVVFIEVLLILASFLFIVIKRQEKAPRVLATSLLLLNGAFFIFAMIYWADI